MKYTSGAAIQATFENAGTHEIPIEISPPPREWRQPYQRNATLLGLEDISFDRSFQH